MCQLHFNKQLYRFKNRGYDMSVHKMRVLDSNYHMILRLL